MRLHGPKISHSAHERSQSPLRLHSSAPNANHRLADRRQNRQNLACEIFEARVFVRSRCPTHLPVDIQGCHCPSAASER
jgi:hypothetical protein